MARKILKVFERPFDLGGDEVLVTASVGIAVLTRAIIAMADGLKIETVAEGVETKGQHEFLHSRKCLYGQGYHFSKAVPAEEFLAYVITVNGVSVA